MTDAPAVSGIRRRPVVAGVDGSESALAAVGWAAAEAARRRLPLRLLAAHTWPAGGLVGDPGLGVDPRAVLRESTKVLDSIADKKIIHKYKASRHKSRLSAAIKAMA